MNSTQAKINPQLQNLKQMPLQPLSFEQLDKVVGGAKEQFDRRKPHVNVSG